MPTDRDQATAASGSDYCEPGGPCEIDCVDGCVDKSTADIPHTGFGDCGCPDCWPADPIGCSDAASSTHRLVLEIEVPDFYVDGTEEPLPGSGAEYGLTLLDVVREEWMREDVGLTFVSIPGEKNLTSDFEVHAMNGRIVGARIAKDERG